MSDCHSLEMYNQGQRFGIPVKNDTGDFQEIDELSASLYLDTAPNTRPVQVHVNLNSHESDKDTQVVSNNHNKIGQESNTGSISVSTHVEQKKEKKLKLPIYTLAGKTVKMDCLSKDDYLHDLKDKIAEKTSYTPNEYHLLLGGSKQLTGTKPLGDFGVERGSKLYMVEPQKTCRAG